MTELLWGRQHQPSRGPKPAMTLAGIAEAAIRIADAEGLDAVSMQRVADDLPVTKMALYRYVPGQGGTGGGDERSGHRACRPSATACRGARR